MSMEKRTQGCWGQGRESRGPQMRGKSAETSQALPMSLTPRSAPSARSGPACVCSGGWPNGEITNALRALAGVYWATGLSPKLAPSCRRASVPSLQTRGLQPLVARRRDRLKLNASLRRWKAPPMMLRNFAAQERLDAGPPPPDPPTACRDGGLKPLELGDIRDFPGDGPLVTATAAARGLERKLPWRQPIGLLHLPLGGDHPRKAPLQAMLAARTAAFAVRLSDQIGVKKQKSTVGWRAGRKQGPMTTTFPRQSSPLWPTRSSTGTGPADGSLACGRLTCPEPALRAQGWPRWFSDPAQFPASMWVVGRSPRPGPLAAVEPGPMAVRAARSTAVLVLS